MDSRSPGLVSELILMRELWRTFVSGRFFLVFEQSCASGCDASGQEILAITHSLSLIRDGGLRGKKNWEGNIGTSTCSVIFLKILSKYDKMLTFVNSGGQSWPCCLCHPLNLSIFFFCFAK